jgi:Cu-Zn family superoxide dismutase
MDRVAVVAGLKHCGDGPTKTEDAKSGHASCEASQPSPAVGFAENLMRLGPLAVAVIFIFANGVGQATTAQSSPGAQGKTVDVELINAKRQQVGEAILTETPNGLLIRVNLKSKAEGISPGTHAIHIHEIGRCEPPFTSAGGHFNPAKQRHGFLTKEGKHAGDLPNIHVAENAPLSIEYLVPQMTLSAGPASLMDADGSALVIHQGKDDYRTDPAGDSGDRIACGVIKGSAPTK